MPVGTLAPYAGAKMPKGWLPCDGRELYRNEYPELFEAIGYSYAGQPDHHSFNLPIAGPMVRTGPHYSEFEDRLEVSMESPFAGSYYIIKAK
jgi:microcystin-dependent protein